MGPASSMTAATSPVGLAFLFTLSLLASCGVTRPLPACQDDPPPLELFPEHAVTEITIDDPLQDANSPMADPALAGWQDAGRNPGQPGETLRANWVMLTETGQLHGTVLATDKRVVSGMRIFLLQDGFVRSRTLADQRGNFQLEGLSPGLHTLVGYSPSAIVAFGLNLVAWRDDAIHIPRRVMTRCITASRNKVRVGKLVNENSPRVRFSSVGQYPFGEDTDDPVTHFGWRGLSRSDPPAVAATSIQSRIVVIGNDGFFTGRIHQAHEQTGRPVPIRQTTVMLVSHGRVLAKTDCDRLGVFRFSGVGPGDYGLVAAGHDGLAAIGLRLVLDGDRERIPARDARTRGLVSGQLAAHRPDTVHSAPVAVDLTLIQPLAVGWLNHFVSEERFEENISRPRPAVAAPYCPDCFQSARGAAPPCGCR